MSERAYTEAEIKAAWPSDLARPCVGNLLANLRAAGVSPVPDTNGAAGAVGSGQPDKNGEECAGLVGRSHVPSAPSPRCGALHHWTNQTCDLARHSDDHHRQVALGLEWRGDHRQPGCGCNDQPAAGATADQGWHEYRPAVSLSSLDEACGHLVGYRYCGLPRSAGIHQRTIGRTGEHGPNR